VKRRFDRAFDPPAPMAPLRLRAPSGLDAAELNGKIDTGADLCAVPELHIEQLDLPAVRTVRAAGFSGALQEVVVYRVDLEIDGLCFERIEAVATKRPYAIVGRNVLRRLVVRFDGPSEQLEIRQPGAAATPQRKRRR
jgi:predicted aspartyl protease